jgi:hypothetical protein
MNCQEFMDQAGAPASIVFSENRLIRDLYAGVGVLLSIISAFTSGKNPGMQNDRIRGGQNG